MFFQFRTVWLMSFVVLVLPSLTFAQDGRSLKWAPADSAIYFAMMNNDVKFDAVVNSRAYQEFVSNEMVQVFWGGFEEAFVDGFKQGFERQIDEDFPGEDVESAEEFVDWIRSEQAKEVWELTRDVFRKEFFVYADGKLVDLYRQAIKIQMRVLQQQMSDPDWDEDDILEYLHEELETELKELEIPSIVMGGVLENPDRARELLAKLNGLMVKAIEEEKDDAPIHPRDVYKYEVDGNNVLLGFHFRSEDIDWEQLFEEADPDVAKFKEQIIGGLEGKSLAIGMAVRNNTLFITAGSNFDHLDDLGSGDGLLDRVELKPLRAHLERKLSSVFYQSDEFAKAGNETNFLEVYLKSMIHSVRVASDNFDGNEELGEQLAADAEEFGKDLKTVIPEPGARLQFSLLVDNGIEGYVYNWTESRTFDGSKPLSILSHVGGDPALMWAGRANYNMEDYELGVKWLRRVFDRVREHVPQAMDNSEEAETFLNFIDQSREILSDCNQTTKTKWMPSTADGQSAFVLDFELAKDKWHPMMPSGDDVVPLPGLALVFSVSDSQLFREAAGEYFDQLQGFVDLLGELPDSQIPPNFEIPRPESRELGNATMYYYPIVDQIGLDPDLLPNAAMNEDTTVLTLSPVQSERLLTETPLRIAGSANSPLSDTNQPLMMAMHYNNAATMDAVQLWANYAYELYQQYAPAPNDFQPGPYDPQPRQEPDEIIELVKVTINLFKCFQSYSSTTYLDEGAQVTHYLYHFKDTGNE